MIDEEKPKTVGEFVKELQALPQDLPIIVREQNYHAGPDYFDYSPSAEMDIFKEKVFIYKE